MASSQLSGMLVREQNGSPIRLGQEIKCGGEGCIYTVVGEPRLVAKGYHHFTTERNDKLKAMLHHPPVDQMTEEDSLLFAWPIDTILDGDDRRVGFLMPYIDHSHHFDLYKLYNPKDRYRTAPQFTWRHLLRTSANLANVLARLHAKRYVVGDLNESNIFVSSEALVTLVDCDSIQVSEATGRIFRCSVGKPEYTPPELQDCNFNLVNREPVHDNFGLAVLIFMLLMEGVHPFEGSNPQSDQVTLREENIRAGHWPYAFQTPVHPPRYALPFNTLPPGVQDLMYRCFIHSYHSLAQRPTALEWHSVLCVAQEHLAHCKKNKQHWYSDHLNSCPWCDRANVLGRDPFPTRKQWEADQKRLSAQKRRQIVQAPLSAVTRQSPSRRVAVSRRPQKFSRRTFIQRVAGFVAIMGIMAGVGEIVGHIHTGRTQFVYHGHTLQVNAVAWSANGKRIASTSDDRTVQVWDAFDGSHVLIYRGHSEAVTSVAWSPDGTRIASAGNSAVQLWNAIDGSLIYTHPGKSSVAWSPDGTRIASASLLGSMQTWDAVDGSNVLTFANPGNLLDVNVVAWSPDSTRIASVSLWGNVQMWDATDGGLIYTYDSKSLMVSSVAWSPDGKYIALGVGRLSIDGYVEVLNAADGSQSHVFTYHRDSDSANAVAWSPDGLRMASAWAAAGVLVWKALDGSDVIQYQGHTDAVNAVAWSPDGKYIASGSGITGISRSRDDPPDTTVQVWNATP